jgi:hypothetical protein
VIVERGDDCADDTIQIGQNIIVPEPDNAVATRVQPRRPGSILLPLHVVLPAIDLDNQPRVETGKISDEVADGHLATKLEPTDLPLPQGRPQLAFRVGGSLSQAAGVLDGHVAA